MKFRTGFVTNSSSSSFIIQKRGNETSIEEIFMMMKELYADYRQTVKDLIAYCSQHPKYEIVKDAQTQKPLYVKLADTIGCDYLEECDALEDKFGIGFHHYFENADWIDTCNTYEEYIKFFNGNPPFEIVNLANEKSLDGIIGWYMPCYCEEDMSDFVDCNKCHCADFCEVKENCPSLAETIKSAKKTTEIIFKVFGQYCITSECGLMPPTVVDKLYKMCMFACNHMG